MSKAAGLYLVAWVIVPVAFALYVNFAYSWSLGRGTLPFLGAHELRWWIGFVSGLVLGVSCVTLARPRIGVMAMVWPALYAIAMAAVLLGTHLAVACGHGDCL
jgi:hypothetical protein